MILRQPWLGDLIDLELAGIKDGPQTGGCTLRVIVKEIAGELELSAAETQKLRKALKRYGPKKPQRAKVIDLKSS